MIGPFPVIWFISGLLYVVLEKGLLGDTLIYPSTGNIYDFRTSLFSIPIGITLLGFLLGFIEVSFFRNSLKNYAFSTRILLKTFFYTFSIFAFLVVTTFPINSYRLDLPIFHPLVVESITNFIFDFVFLSILIYAGVFICISLFVSETINNLGIAGVTNFFTGKYNKPGLEDRIFMFLDMKSSTTIAEKLGNLKYYELLNRYYQDMTYPIIDTEGEIYQYVGDEIVISWKLKNGIRNNNCIECFFGIRAEIESNQDKYINDFQLVPEFKAGLHVGKVTVGQIGVLKKEILFTGDLLNTTSRIQSMCNSLKSDLLVSSSLAQKLNMNSYRNKSMGEFQLRGKDQVIDLYSID